MHDKAASVLPHRSSVRALWAAHLADIDHRGVVDTVREDAGISAHFLFMLFMSAGIAVLGLLLSSPAVVIGAMLISPLMGPIIGLGFALATFDFAEIRRTALALALGVMLAVLFCALIVALSPLQTVTSEIAARTRPNLFDLLVALLSGLAGTYAMIRGRQGAIVGVAIATALMPPLAVVGFGLATLNATVLWGSTLLFFTNLMTIAASAAILARLYGFAPNLSPQQTGLQATLIVATLLALAIPLALTLKQIAWEALASREASSVIARQFGDEARVSDITLDYDADPIVVDATVLTPDFRSGAQATAQRELSRLLDVPVRMHLEQFRVRTAEGEAAAAQLAAARGTASAKARGALADRLALIAGVSPDKVLIDDVNNRAMVRAAALPGATVATYRVLEQRVAGTEPQWRVTLVPPALPLPAVSFEGDRPDEAGSAALADAIWAAQRIHAPVGVATSSAARADTVIAAMSDAGIEARRVAGGGSDVSLTWLPPTAQAR